MVANVLQERVACSSMYSKDGAILSSEILVTPDKNARVGSEVLVKMTVLFWVMTPCRLVSRHRRFGGTYYLHVQERRIRSFTSRNITMWIYGINMFCASFGNSLFVLTPNKLRILRYFYTTSDLFVFSFTEP
jgi:hypothetical protein